MSTATAADAPLPAKGHKKLILIIALAVLLLGGAGGGALLLLKKQAQAQDEVAEDEDGAPVRNARAASGASPVFVPLDMFTVNLADRNADRYAQIGITLEIDGSDTGDRIKTFMPAIRNNILMAIADRTAAELLAREGKTELAERVKRETARALGYDVPGPEPEPEDAAAPARKKRHDTAPPLPVHAVHFSNFIIQ